MYPKVLTFFFHYLKRQKIVYADVSPGAFCARRQTGSVLCSPESEENIQCGENKILIAALVRIRHFFRITFRWPQPGADS